MARPIESTKELYREVSKDDLGGEAAKLAYYAFLSLFPLVLVVFALTGIVGGDAAFHWIMGRLTATVPGETAQYLGQFVREVTGKSRPGLLSIGLVLSLWSASNVVTALGRGLNRMYGVRETRSFLKLRGISLGLLALGTVAVVGGAVAMIAGPQIAHALGPVGSLVFRIVSLPLTFLAIVATLYVTYYVLPNRDQRQAKREVVIGAVIGSGLWLAATALFRFYVSHFGSYSKTYGLVGGVIVLLLWLYLSGAVVLFGGEVVAWLETRKGHVPGDGLAHA